MNTVHIVAAVLLGMGGYLLGAIPFGVLVGRAGYGVDVREHGSHNIGTTNVFRVLGARAGIIVLVCDIAKGWAPAFVAVRFFPPWVAVLIAVMPMIGHMKSVFLRGGGGKAAAAGAGMVLGLMWPVALIVTGVCVVVLVSTRIMSLATIVATLVFPVAAWLLHEPLAYRIASFAVCAAVLWTHRSNIGRLLKGTEPRVHIGHAAPPATGGGHPGPA